MMRARSEIRRSHGAVDAPARFAVAEDPPSRRAIVEAALRLFVRDGYKETTIRAIADEASYTNPALFKFFASKDELGAFLFLRCHQFFVSHVERFMSDKLDDSELDDTMAGWVAAFFDLLATDRDVVLFVHEYAATFSPMVADKIDGDAFARLHAWLRRARASGKVSGAVPLRLQGALLVGTLHQIARSVDVAALPASDRKKLERDTALLLAGALRT